MFSFCFSKALKNSYEIFMADLLHALLAPARLTAVVDVGANPVDGNPSYKPMLEAGLCEVVGFEPLPEAFQALQEKKGPRERYLPYALGDGTDQVLHICDLEGMTSLLVPRPEHLALFNLFPKWGQVKSAMPVTTRKLDDIEEIQELDFLKMDAQGSEYEILNHGQAKLARAVAIQTEVSFITLYEGQRAFGAMDLKLRELGFIPHCFAELKVWPLSPTVVGDKPNKGLRQLLEADMVYVRDFTQAKNMSAEQWKHLALIAHHCYGSIDLAVRAINILAELGAVSKDTSKRYLQSLPRRKPSAC